MSVYHVNLPVDLVVGSVMHEVWLEIAKARAHGDSRNDGTLHELVARRLLASIASNVDMPTVLRCLALAGAPASLDDIREGLQAITDRQSPPITTPNPPPITIKAPPAPPERKP